MPEQKMERFTERARRVLSLAQYAAEQYKHEVVDTEHLLLGLMHEGGGVGFLTQRSSLVPPIGLNTAWLDGRKPKRSGHP